ncbi:hypothetical protein FH972_016758 [Carpinus fangiana]|uniref:Galactose oxidase-like Early set domain-containing protein n=1 Tax=Carpinus fangiana TaxID=176857 RepID=A0A5N6RIW8_9ROSI|nr:hypothetical protein FH972_016758 [Carpinus fangiana]
MVVQSTDIVSSPLENKKGKTDGSSSSSSSPPYEVLISMPIYVEGERESIERLYTMEIYADGTERYDSYLGPFLTPNVYKVNIRDPSGGWIHVKPMISPRMNPYILVLGGKLYTISGYPSSSPSGVPPTARGGEVYDPIADSWQALPDPPCYLGTYILSAALENPKRILVASFSYDEENEHVDFSSVNFFIYEVQNCC